MEKIQDFASSGNLDMVIGFTEQRENDTDKKDSKDLTKLM